MFEKKNGKIRLKISRLIRMKNYSSNTLECLFFFFQCPMNDFCTFILQRLKNGWNKISTFFFLPNVNETIIYFKVVLRYIVLLPFSASSTALSIKISLMHQHLQFNFNCSITFCFGFETEQLEFSMLKSIKYQARKDLKQSVATENFEMVPQVQKIRGNATL